jgi:hypothetical protein
MTATLAALITRLRRRFGYAPAPRHYPKTVCLVCGKTIALTSKGAWKHRCVVKRSA